MTTLIALTQRLNDLAWEIKMKQDEVENLRTAQSPYPEDLNVFSRKERKANFLVEIKKERFKQVLKQIEEQL